MKILWIVNMVLPDIADALNLKTNFSGGWLVDYSNRLSEDSDFELAIMTYANVDNYIDKKVSNIRSFIFPGGGKMLLLTSNKTIKDCKKVIDEFKPDLIHLHGTEYSMAYSMLKVCGDIPVLLTIQGILTRISQEYYGGLKFSQIIRMGTLKEYIRLKTPFCMKLLYSKNAKRERYVLRNVKYVTGRTDWDMSVMHAVNNKLTYFRHNYNLREEFYDADKWNVEDIEPFTIYAGASLYPLKGLHIVLDALKIVKEEYPQVKLIMPGIDEKTINSKMAKPYQKYIVKKINDLGIRENVVFAGRKNATEIAKMLKKANVCIVSSAMEGASATICEAMMIGTPCICPYRGGMTELLKDKESGFYYDFPEYSVLATRIKQLFADRELCNKFSENVIHDAEIRHDRKKNYFELKKLYQTIIDKEKFYVES
ncbi:MAG: glycosyltransferase family 4 protein [Clostridia bacterium]|nr:glycosyltransferase family 4 protein [Clostridia bacterium]